jgi:hypothetical protein
MMFHFLRLENPGHAVSHISTMIYLGLVYIVISVKIVVYQVWCELGKSSMHECLRSITCYMIILHKIKQDFSKFNDHV